MGGFGVWAGEVSCGESILGGGRGGKDAGSVPTTCAQAGGTGGNGCCDGNELYYCNTNNGVSKQNCASSGMVCGWDSTGPYYNCVAAPGGVDPGGTPIACQ